MKRLFVLFTFYLVGLALVSNIVASAVICTPEIEIVETEESEKGVEKETDFEKDKIAEGHYYLANFINAEIIQHLHPPVDISTLVLDPDINPPDYN
ncbi:MAG: hypothetical protein H7Y31_10030 [Chitinophagaceae bacterium]|nr:hypothetical protein [Chitinophagaceae bacterium]